jgi:hypothetical protein
MGAQECLNDGKCGRVSLLREDINTFSCLSLLRDFVEASARLQPQPVIGHPLDPHRQNCLKINIQSLAPGLLCHACPPSHCFAESCENNHS